MARPLTPREATEMIMALRREHGAPSHRPAPAKRGRKAKTRAAERSEPASGAVRRTAGTE